MMTQPFTGALVGSRTWHNGEAIALEERIPVYCAITANGEPDLFDEKPDAPLAAVYYCSQTQDYAVVPYARMSVFLESGQPLGADRTYYLPRQSALYFKERTYTLILG